MAERILNIAPSSNVKGAKYDDESQRLTVEFHSNHSGFYSGVSIETADAFEQSESSGKFVASVLKPSYPYTKIG